MKTIGILGGMSAASTQAYYREFCRLTQDRLGALHSPELLIRSLDFARIAQLQSVGDWEGAGQILNQEAMALERGGAELIVLATNTMHKVADAITEGLSVPFLHIAEVTADRLVHHKAVRPGLIATAFTMEQEFYIDRLIKKGLDPVIPDAPDRSRVHRIIYEELCKDMLRDESREEFVAVAHRLVKRGADSLILGCTEVGMLLNAQNVPVPVFDTTLIHCDAAINAAFEHGT